MGKPAKTQYSLWICFCCYLPLTMGMLPGGSLLPAKYPIYCDNQSRRNTFACWNNPNVLPDVLAAAGFFYTGVLDHVRCFHCGGGLKNWEKGDDPWTEHIRWYPRCYHVRNGV